MKNKCLFWIIAAAIIICAIVIIMKHDQNDTSYTTEVSVKSGTVEVQSPEGTAWLKAGEKAVVGKKG